MKLVVLVLGVAAKYLIPVGLLKSPFIFGWANFILDSVDGDILIPAGLSDPVYQNIDKSADYVTYVFMLLSARNWPLRKWIIGFFVLRTVGQALFFLTHKEIVFFLFPNFLEPLYLVYATILFFKKQEAPAYFSRHAKLLWAIVILYKLQDEYLTHVGNFDRTEFFKGIFS